MVSTRIFVYCMTLLIFLMGLPGICRAEGKALEQLLEIFKQKGLITSEELKHIERALKEDEETLRKRELRLEERERALNQEKRELEKRQRSLQEAQHRIQASQRSVSREATAKTGTEPSVETAERPGVPLHAGYRDGFCLMDDSEDFSLCTKGLLQTDYRYFDYDTGDPENNGFDIRRARLLLGGTLLRHFDYRFQFEGTRSRNLLDAYLDAHLFPVSFRVGQFKEPFGLEQVTNDKDLFFAEHSMGYYLTPLRSLGIMSHASLWGDRVNFGIGLFNGDGLDDSSHGEEDAPELVARLVLSPFKDIGVPVLRTLQFGGSASYAKIDRTDVDIEVSTAGLTTFFDAQSTAKFNIIRDADRRTRYGAEVGWTYGPLAFMGEYIMENYRDVKTSANEFDIELRDYYLALLWMITGERPTFQNGVFQPVVPNKDLLKGGWGALGLALRYDNFEADKDVYDTLIFAGNSVREAEAYTIALNWYLNPYLRLILDATRTRFDLPLLVGKDPLTGETIFSDREDVITARLQLGF
jgi:phosphate-selective porin OprO/OprP